MCIRDRSQGLKSLFENLTVDADTIAQAKKDIAEDGYWGVEKTSDRILDFAKALSGGDKDKADELLNAFKKGFSQATGAVSYTHLDVYKRQLILLIYFLSAVEHLMVWKKLSTVVWIHHL